MRNTVLTVTLVVLGGVTFACSGQHGEGIGARDSEGIVDGTGTLSPNSLATACTATDACACPLITVDGDPGLRLAVTNLEAGSVSQQIRIRFRARVTGQTVCGPDVDLADELDVVAEILEMEPL
jgi:hypothetical protein